MIKFFRRIRQSLLSENKFSKYLLYAIGEIILVVIGILIALQINNWNENRKLRDKEVYFLEGIKNDLASDTIQINQLKKGVQRRLTMYKLIDPEFSLDEFDQVEIDTVLNFRYLFNRTASFRSKAGSYNSLISDGQSQLISNKVLFDKIQDVYQHGVPSLESLYNDLKQVELNIKSKWVKERKYVPYEYYKEITDKKLIADLFSLHGRIRWFGKTLLLHKNQIAEVISEIDKEIASKKN